MKRIGVLALLFVLLASSVSAQVEDFSVFREDVLFTEQGTPADSHFRITNTGQVASGYSIGVIGSEASSWVSMGPLSFVLQPGQEQIVLLHLDIPRGVDAGRYDLDTVITTTLGNQAVLEQIVRVDIPQNILLESVPSQDIVSCGTADYDIIIHNTGPFADEYSLSVSENVADYATISDSKVVAAGEQDTISLTLAPTDCQSSGEIPFTVTGVADSTQSTAELDLVLNIENEFIPEISVKNIRLNTDSNTFNATIANTGSEENTYTIDVTGADFVSVSPSMVTLGPDEETVLEITSIPRQDTEQKKYDLELNANVNGVEYFTPFVLNIKNPTWLESRIWIVYVVAAVIIFVAVILLITFARYLARRGTPEYEAEQAEKIRLAAENADEKAAERAEKEKEQEKTKRQKEKEKEAKRKQKEQDKFRKLGAKEAAAELRATNVLVSKDKLQGDATVKRGKSFWWIALIVLILIATAVIYGSRAWIIANVMASIVGAIILAVIIILLIIYFAVFGASKASQRWIGMKPRRENQIETRWSKGLGQMWIRVKELIPDVRMKLKGSRKNPSFVAPDAHVYQYFTIKADGLSENQIEKQRFMFRVSKKWLQRHDIAEGKVKLMRTASEGDWKGVGTTKVRSDDKWVYYQAQATGLDAFAITGTSKTKTPKGAGAPGWWLFVLGIIIVLAVLGGFWYFSVAGTQGTDVVGVAPEVSGIPPQAWDEDTRLKIDLSEYFVDPDGDRLSYVYTPVDNIVITISGDTATLTPEKDWFGEGSTTFTASDGKGGRVSSNEVSLYVRDIEEPTFWQNVLNGVQIYAAYIVVGIVILVILIVLLSRRSDK